MTVIVTLLGMQNTGSGSIIEVGVAGHLPPGSASNDEVAKMCSAVQGIVQSEKPSAILFNLSQLHYEWGDSILSLAYACFDRGARTIIPGCLLAEGKTADALESLINLGSTHLIELFRNRDDAILFLQAQRIVEIPEKTQLTDFQHRCLHLIRNVFGVLDRFPDWTSESEGQDPGVEYLHTSFHHGEHSYSLFVYDNELGAHVDSRWFPFEQSDFSHDSGSLINAFVQFTQGCLHGDDPIHAYNSAKSQSSN
jgi:hypothetical protein